jgi:hypothetical protein
VAGNEPLLLGFLAVGALWVIGIGQTFSKDGSWIIAFVALVVGLIMIVLGMNQSSFMVGEYHRAVRTVRLLVGLMTIGLGHTGTARHRSVFTE